MPGISARRLFPAKVKTDAASAIWQEVPHDQMIDPSNNASKEIVMSLRQNGFYAVADSLISLHLDLHLRDMCQARPESTRCILIPHKIV